MEDHMEVVQCNQPAIIWLAGFPGNGTISGVQCGSLLLTGCILSNDYSQISMLFGPT